MILIHKASGVVQDALTVVEEFGFFVFLRKTLSSPVFWKYFSLFALPFFVQTFPTCQTRPCVWHSGGEASSI